MIELYSAAMTLLVCGTFGTPGYLTWGAVWAVLVYRHILSPTKEKDTSKG